MKEEYVRHIYYYKHYYLNFFQSLNAVVKKKFVWTLKLIATIERVPTQYLKHLENTDSLFEIRVEVGSDIYRVFCFFDKDQLVILINGFRKKSQKTPKREIELTQKIKKNYFNEKERNKPFDLL